MKKTKTVILFGGSFNPITHGHLGRAAYVAEQFKPDETWFLFSRNWQKDQGKIAPTEHRIAMAKLLHENYYREQNFVMSDLQDQWDTHTTLDVVTRLQSEFPNTKFLWCMGADSFAGMNSWVGFEQLMGKIPMIVLDRPGYREAAEQSIAARDYGFLKSNGREDLVESEGNWLIIDNPLDQSSSTAFHADLLSGRQDFGDMQLVVDYIRKHGLYNFRKGDPVSSAAAGLPLRVCKI